MLFKVKHWQLNDTILTSRCQTIYAPTINYNYTEDLLFALSDSLELFKWNNKPHL